MLQNKKSAQTNNTQLVTVTFPVSLADDILHALYSRIEYHADSFKDCQLDHFDETLTAIRDLKAVFDEIGKQAPEVFEYFER